MIIKQLAVPKTSHQSFHIRRDFKPRHQSVWHYHEELEMVHVFKGSGTLFLGDCIKPFESGDTALIGPQIPHYWLFDDYPNNLEESTIDCLVIHFLKDFNIPQIFHAPEFSNIKGLLDTAARGAFLSHQFDKLSPTYLGDIDNHAGISKFSLLLQFLDGMSGLPVELLTSENYARLNHTEDQYRMNSLMEYIRLNFKQKIRLEDLAHIAGLTENSFCRYFKQKTSKTPIQFLTEIRISHACFQLRNSDASLKEICYDSGFNNFVSFHKLFKLYTGETPNTYKLNIKRK
ncbi:AraC family transcriptional regulator [Sphingobacterium sp. HJSM2_6]|uniref:AraC family transcriptional regulator n=1 Tax=Sphingobacterium sp. HJSM2_6 TaxID=3366264 RepID=UPI003BD705BA